MKSFFVLSVLDLLLTILFLEMGVDEQNPVGAYVLQQHGVFGLVFLKAYAIAVVLSIYKFLLNHQRHRAMNILRNVAILASSIAVLSGVWTVTTVLTKPKSLAPEVSYVEVIDENGNKVLVNADFKPDSSREKLTPNTMQSVNVSQ